MSKDTDILQTILSYVNTLTTSEYENLINEMTLSRNKHLREKYVIVKVYPGEIITRKISEETGYACEHVKSTRSGRGAHFIYVPREKYTEEIETKLIDVYDDDYL